MDNESPKFTCEICSAEFTKRRNLTRHHRNFHQEQRVLYICNTCGKAFTRLDTLKRHEKTQHVPEVQVDHGEHRFVCSECNAQFIEEKHCKDHSETHHQKEIYLCHTCGRVYHQRDKFMKHVSTHSTQAPSTSVRKRKPTVDQSPHQAKRKLNFINCRNIVHCNGCLTVFKRENFT